MKKLFRLAAQALLISAPVVFVVVETAPRISGP
jgi:hypothetical protein